MNKAIKNTTIANALGLLLGGCGYLVYSKVLSSSDFALYGICLVAGRLGVTVLDAGMKISIIRSPNDPTQSVVDAAIWLSIYSSLALLLLFSLLGWGGVAFSRWDERDFGVCALYMAAYLFTYPMIVVPLAMLERRMRFQRIAIVESLGNSIELMLPALFLQMDMGMWAFPAGAWLGRFIRLAGVIGEGPRVSSFPGSEELARIPLMLKQSLYYQMGLLSSLLRDNLALFIIGPIFGKVVLGQYVWVGQLCSFVTQVFVASSTRVSISLLSSSATPEERWGRVLSQINFLARFVFPSLVLVFFIAPIANSEFFNSKWDFAIGILPFMLVRIMSAIATTPLGASLLVTEPTKSFAKASFKWTLVEFLFAAFAIAVFGAKGMAMSAAVVGWVGAYFIMQEQRELRGKFLSVIRIIFVRSEFVASLLVALLAVFLTYIWSQQ